MTTSPDHASLTTAESLMRARYAASVRRDADFLLATWHEDTRPPAWDYADEPEIRWRGLVVIDTVRGAETDADGVVEFRAVYVTEDGQRGELHERSYFLKEDGLWFYVHDDLASDEDEDDDVA